MKYVLLFLVTLLLGVTPLSLSAKTLFAVPASPRGAFADILTGTKLLRENGITVKESSANIVELRLGLIKSQNGVRQSFLTLPGDTFFFDETSIWLERKGQALATYFLETKEGTYEVHPSTLVFRPTVPVSKQYIAKTPQPTATQKNTPIKRATPHVQQNQVQPVVLTTPVELVQFTAPATYASATDSILALPRPSDATGLTFEEFMIIMGEIHPDTQFTKTELQEIRHVFEGGPPPSTTQKNTHTTHIQGPETVP